MAEVQALFEAFKKDYESGKDVKALQSQVVKLKIAMTKYGLLQSTQSQDRKLARSVLEYAALLSLRENDVDGFVRNVAQVKTFYDTDSDESPLRYEIIGLNLLHLLNGKIDKFHTELELIPIAKRSSEKFVSYPVAMEQFMMEGSYHKVISSLNKVPSPSFEPFARALAETVRLRIAECVSQAYSFLSEKDLRELLLLGPNQSVELYAKEYGWVRKGDGYDFSRKKSGDDKIPMVQVMEQTLNLAQELERII